MIFSIFFFNISNFLCKFNGSFLKYPDTSKKHFSHGISSIAPSIFSNNDVFTTSKFLIFILSDSKFIEESIILDLIGINTSFKNSKYFEFDFSFPTRFLSNQILFCPQK